MLSCVLNNAFVNSYLEKKEAERKAAEEKRKEAEQEQKIFNSIHRLYIKYFLAKSFYIFNLPYQGDMLCFPQKYLSIYYI